MKKLSITLAICLLSFGVKPQVKLLSLSNLEHRVSQGKDTTYVVNFWATWCGPCVEELPAFEQLHKNLKKQPYKVILMSLDFKSKLEREVIPFVKKHKLQAEVFVVNEADQQAFIDRVDKNWSGALPATLIMKANALRYGFYERTFTYADLLKVVKQNN